MNSEEDMLSFFRDLEDESRSVGNLEEEETNPRVQEVGSDSQGISAIKAVWNES